jgi:hypothetical protein
MPYAAHGPLGELRRYRPALLREVLGFSSNRRCGGAMCHDGRKGLFFWSGGGGGGGGGVPSTCAARRDGLRGTLSTESAASPPARALCSPLGRCLRSPPWSRQPRGSRAARLCVCVRVRACARACARMRACARRTCGPFSVNWISTVLAPLSPHRQHGLTKSSASVLRSRCIPCAVNAARCNAAQRVFNAL